MLRRATPEDWERIKELRLRALVETPEAFGRTVEEEQAYPDELWQTRLGNADAATFVEDAGDHLDASVTVIVDRAAGTAEIFGMFVEPSRRRQGLARALLTAAEEWAYANTAQEFRLEVNRALTPARTLYERAGYTPTGQRRGIDTSGATAIAMSKAMAPRLRGA